MLLDKPFALRVVSSVESSESSDATIEGTDLWKVLRTRRDSGMVVSLPAQQHKNGEREYGSRKKLRGRETHSSNVELGAHVVKGVNMFDRPRLSAEAQGPRVRSASLKDLRHGYNYACQALLVFTLDERGRTSTHQCRLFNDPLCDKYAITVDDKKSRIWKCRR